MRSLTDAERDLVKLLLISAGDQRPIAGLVEEMADGQMGSLRFAGPAGRRYGGIVAQAEFRDADETLVYAALLLDEVGALFELDVWKVDFSPLMKIPPVEQIAVAP